VIRPTPLPDIAAVARRDGLAAGLTAAFDLREPVPCSAGGRTLIPPGLLPVVGGWSPAGVEVPAGQCRVEIEPHDLARSEHLVMVRVTPLPSAPRAGTGRTAAGTDPAGSTWPAALLAVRAGLGRRLLGRAIEELAGRTSDGAPLTERQLVRAEIAEIAITLEAVETALPTLPTRPADAGTEFWHDEIDRADQSLSRLFGASGYLDDHPGRVLRLVGLIRDVYAPPGIGLAA
jgi:hypothetical protein